MIYLAQIVVAIAAAIVLSYSVATTNRMTPKTDHRIRLAFVLLASGAFGELVAIFQLGHAPGVAETLFMLGNAMLSFFCRRTKPRCCVKETHDDAELHPRRTDADGHRAAEHPRC